MKFKAYVNGKVFEKPSKLVKHVIDNKLTTHSFKAYIQGEGHCKVRVVKKKNLSKNLSHNNYPWLEYSRYEVVKSF